MMHFRSKPPIVSSEANGWGVVPLVYVISKMQQMVELFQLCSFYPKFYPEIGCVTIVYLVGVCDNVAVGVDKGIGK